MVPTTNHFSYGIMVECVNIYITRVVYQVVLDKWVDSTNSN
jgi:hypothetical protein